MLQGWNPSWTVRRFDAAAALDGAGHSFNHPSGVSAVIERRADGTLTLAAMGPTDELVASSRWAGAPITDRRGCLLIPGLVNAHTHLDLTHIGPRPHDPADGFAVWINMILRERLSEQAAIAGAVQQGVTFLLAGGTVLVGDIAGAVGGIASEIPGRALAEDGRINGTSYVEFFAHGENGHLRTVPAYEAWRNLSAAAFPRGGGGGHVVFGVQPHAPYSVGLRYYEDIFKSVAGEAPLCTHLAESVAEHEFIAQGTGPFQALLERLGLWDRFASSEVGRGHTPIGHLQTYLQSEPLAVVHCNDVSDADLAILAETATPVMYCPRSSAYFGAHRDFGPHRYRDMLAAGITVALGTDSIVNLDTADRISVWDEMRFLHQRDGTDPLTLLGMATINGATALRRDPASFTFKPMGTLAGLAAIPVSAANRSTDPSELLRAVLVVVKSGQGGGGAGVDAAGLELLALGRV